MRRIITGWRRWMNRSSLGKRLEDIRSQLRQGLMTSPEFLKALLDVLRDPVQAKREADTVEEQLTAISALTGLLNQARSDATPKVVDQVAQDSDAGVRVARFPGRQRTKHGEREVKKALRRTLLKYRLHKEQELFDYAQVLCGRITRSGQQVRKQ